MGSAGHSGAAMENADFILLAATGLVLLAVAGAAATNRAGAPLLLVFLSLGMLAGVEGPGRIDFHAHDQAYADRQKHQIPISVKSETAAECSELPCLEHFSEYLTGL